MSNSTIADTASESAALELSSLYGYTPTTSICVLFVVLYSLTALVHIAQATRLRVWWMIPTVVLCGLSEIIGWAARLWSSNNAQGVDPFLIQFMTTIIPPSFLTAAVFNVLALTIRRVGTQYSLFPPRWYLIVFMSLDFAALVIQAYGGGKTYIAVKDGNDPEPGGKMMILGAVAQMIGMTLFCVLGADFLFRCYWNKPLRSAVSSSQINSGPTSPMFTSSENDFRAFSTNVRLMLLGAGITTIWMLIRSIYRTIVFANGWTGRTITTQAYFNVFDGAPIVFAMFTLNFFHPGWLLREENRSGLVEWNMTSGTHSISETSEFGREEYGLDAVRPKGDYILPLTLELGWAVNVDDLWKLVTSIEH